MRRKGDDALLRQIARFDLAFARALAQINVALARAERLGERAQLCPRRWKFRQRLEPRAIERAAAKNVGDADPACGFGRAPENGIAEPREGLAGFALAGGKPKRTQARK